MTEAALTVVSAQLARYISTSPQRILQFSNRREMVKIYVGERQNGLRFFPSAHHALLRCGDPVLDLACMLDLHAAIRPKIADGRAQSYSPGVLCRVTLLHQMMAASVRVALRRGTEQTHWTQRTAEEGSIHPSMHRWSLIPLLWHPFAISA